MHGTIPSGVDLSLSAMSLVGIYHIARRRRCPGPVESLFEPADHSYVVDSIRVTRIPEYFQLVESLIAEEYQGKWIPDCPYCGSCTIVHDQCQACFASVDWIECKDCGEEYVVLSADFPDDMIDRTCPVCGRDKTA